jgi:hypothetical protein
MYGTNLSSHQQRLEVVFGLKLEQVRDIILGKYKVTSKDILNLVSDLIEIRQKLEFMQPKMKMDRLK